MELENPSHGEIPNSPPPPHPLDAIEGSSSSASTPFVSAPSSPGRADGGGGGGGGYFFSCPASPVHYVLSSAPYSLSYGAASIVGDEASASGSFEFDGAAPDSTMISADELFLNGQIRPLKLSSHLIRPKPLAPLLDLDGDDDDDDDEAQAKEAAGEEGGRGRDLRVRSTSIHRRTRSMSPLRSPRFQWQGDEGEQQDAAEELQVDPDLKDETARPPELASSSRSSSGSRSSKWIFLKDLLLHRSKSEGSWRGNGKEKEKFWHSISFSPSSKSKPPLAPASAATPPLAAPDTSSAAAEQNKAKTSRRPANGVGRRRGTSAHERLYTTNRAQAEEMRRRTFLPYRQGLLGCLGFTSRSYGAFNGLAKVLNPVTSR